MKRLLIALSLMIAVLVCSASGFDGKRKGFVLGGGLGIMPGSSWSLDTFDVRIGFLTEPPIDENKTGMGMNLRIGFAWNESNMVVFESNLSRYNSDILRNRIVIQGFSGPTLYHHFGRVGKSFFVAAGLGFYFFDVDDFEAFDPGLGLLVGGGLEFARHIQMAGYFASGKTSDNGVDYGHSHFSILVSAVAF